MVDSILSHDLEQLIKEVERYEEITIKNNRDANDNVRDTTLFWYFKARLLMIGGYYADASLILQALYKKFPPKYIFHGEVAYLLSQSYNNLNRHFKADSLLSEAKLVFSSFNIKIS
jgi:hypothetical protein